jgi:hypothetical protein
MHLFSSSHPALLMSYGTKTRRKPMLLLRLSGLFLLRFATRQFSGLLFQLPPRITRFEPSIHALFLFKRPSRRVLFAEMPLHRRVG